MDQALPSQSFRTGQKLEKDVVLKYWQRMARCFDGSGVYKDRKSSTNYLGFFLATKMVVPLERARIAILALNKENAIFLI